MMSKEKPFFPLAETIKEEFNAQLTQLERFTSHGPSLGRFVEVLLIQLLRKHLPLNIDFATGFIQPMNPVADLSSSQIDIICYDRINYPLLFDVGEIKVVPSAAVRGIIEVKSTITKSKLIGFLKLSESDALVEVAASSKMYIIALQSQVKPKAAFKVVKEYYDLKPKINKFLGGILSLDWNEMLVFYTSEQETEIQYGIGRIFIGDLGLSPFLGMLLADLYGHDQLKAVANKLAPSIYHSLEEKLYTLHTKESGLLTKKPNAT